VTIEELDVVSGKYEGGGAVSEECNDLRCAYEHLMVDFMSLIVS
jgi:hypothetical protein